MPQGTIREYFPETRGGSLLQDDYTEILIDEGSLEGSGLRYLRSGQRVSFDVVDERGRRVARNLKIVTFS